MALPHSASVMDHQANGRALPEPLRAAEAEPGFVDRDTEIEALEQAWRDARERGIQFALVAGDPGIGKTRLAARFAGVADSGGGRVVYGRCDPELARPVQPFAEVLEQLAAATPEEDLRALGEAAPPLARVVPALRASLGPVTEPDSDSASPYELFHGVAMLLSICSRRGPLLIVLDDVHAVDRTSALLLRYLCVSPEPIHALLVVTYRQSEVGSGSSIASALTELRRAPGVVDLVLSGLPRDDSVALAQRVAGRKLQWNEAALAEAVHAEAGGNPLYCTQLLRSLAEGGAFGSVVSPGEMRRRLAEVELPGTITETLRARVERLGEDTASILSTAAVLGVEFDAEAVTRMSRRRADEVARALDAGAAAGIVERRVRGGSFAFHHPLICRVLYERNGAASRGRLHRRAATALEELLGTRADERPGELARHWLEADPPNPDRAAELAQRAGETALESFEAAAAAQWFERALQLAPGDEGPRRCDLLTGLGVAQRNVGDPSYRETLLAAARLAADLGDDGRLVAAALANGRRLAGVSGEVDDERIAMLELALERTEGSESEGRARLLAALAAELSFSAEWERRVELSDAAVALARRGGSRRTLCDVLAARFVPLAMPDTLEDRLESSAENVALADRGGRPPEQFAAVHWHSIALVQDGQLSKAARAVERERTLAERLGDPRAAWISTCSRAAQALISGRIATAEDLANDAYRLAEESGQPEALASFADQIANIRYEQGRLPEVQELLAEALAENPETPLFQALLALAYAESDLPGEARRLLLLETEAGFADTRRDITWLAVHVIYAEVCAGLGEREIAHLLRERLEPYAGQVVFTGTSCWGDVDLALGRIAAVSGDLDDAEAHLSSSRTRAQAVSTPVWHVRASMELARVLLRGGSDARAAEILHTAIQEAHDVGVGPLATKAEALRAHAESRAVMSSSDRVAGRMRLQPDTPGEGSTGGSPAPPHDAAAHGAAAEPADLSAASLSREGDTWSIAFGGRSVRLRDTKGMGYLASLLASPGVEHHAVDLQSGPPDRGTHPRPDRESGLSTRAAGADDAGPVLDEQAKRAYRARVEELREEIEEAESFNDPERASRAREELEYVAHELAAAVGLGGRDRKASSGAERARVNVTRAIRKAIGRIQQHDDELGDHLRRSVGTGAFCIYRPGTGPDAIEWDVVNIVPNK